MRTLPEQPAFFDQGLRFECTQCGDCCTGAPGVVRVTDTEINALCSHLELKPEGFRAEFLCEVDGGVSLREIQGGACVFFVEGTGCSVYPARPSQCRRYPFWLVNLRTPEAWNRAAARCPGIGQGPLIDKPPILQHLSEDIEHRREWSR